MSDPFAPTEAAPADRPTVVDATAATFEAVMTESMERLVVVDFWAPWCQPCRMLGPVLEKIADEFGGRFLLAKVNTDTEQQIAGAFGVQSLPTVVAIDKGQPVDAFQGAMGEAEVREWIGRFLPSQIDDLLAEAEQLQHSNVPEAIAAYRKAAETEPSSQRATFGLTRLLVEDNQLEEADRVLTEWTETGQPLGSEGEAIRSMLELRMNAESDELAAARAASDADPSDLSKRLALASALAADGKNEPAMETALDVVRGDRGDHREAAKTFLLGLFEKLGPSPLTSRYRRQLTTALY